MTQAQIDVMTGCAPQMQPYFLTKQAFATARHKRTQLLSHGVLISSEQLGNAVLCSIPHTLFHPLHKRNNMMIWPHLASQECIWEVQPPCKGDSVLRQEFELGHVVDVHHIHPILSIEHLHTETYRCTTLWSHFR